MLEENLVVEISDATVSRLTSNQTKSTALKKIQPKTIWVQLLGLYKHVHQEGTAEEKSDGMALFAKIKLVSSAKHVVFIPAQK